MIYKPSKLGH